MWLKQCEKNERNVNIDNLKDLDQTYIQFTKLKVMIIIHLTSLTWESVILYRPA